MKGVSFDSRSIKRGEVFFAIRGKRRDGHIFLGQAKEKGACALVVDERFYNEHPGVIRGANVAVCRDTPSFLFHFAEFIRKKIKATVIGITGTCGKTTVKDILAILLSGSSNTVASPKSFNNFLGVPYTISLCREDTEFLVCECGSSRPGEIEALARLIRPHYSIITSVGPSHLEFFGNVENVFREKSQMALFTRRRVIVNGDDRYLNRLPSMRKGIVRVGFKKRNDFVIGIKKHTFEETLFDISTLGDFAVKTGFIHQVHNAALALVLAHILGFEAPYLRKRLSLFSFSQMRTQVSRRNGFLVVNDAYNANPFSVKKAILSLGAFKGFNRKIVVLGDMLEQGGRSSFFHREIASFALKAGVDYLLCIGDRSFSTYRQARRMPFKGCYHFLEISPLLGRLRKILRRGDIVLIKGSRAMSLERVAEAL